MVLPYTMEPLRGLVKILDSWPRPTSTKSEFLLGGDWLVCVFELVFQDILYTLKFEDH